MLELAGAVEKVVGVGLGGELASVGLLDKVLVALLVGKVDGVLLGLEAEVGALHKVGGRLPSHQRVLPAVALGEDIPVHAPVVSSPGSGLCGGLGLLEYSVFILASDMSGIDPESILPDGTGLELHGGARGDGGGADVVGSVLDGAGNGGKGPGWAVSNRVHPVDARRAEGHSRGGLVVGDLIIGLVGGAGRAGHLVLAVLGDGALEPLRGDGHGETRGGRGSQNSGGALGSESSHGGIVVAAQWTGNRWDAKVELVDFRRISQCGVTGRVWLACKSS